MDDLGIEMDPLVFAVLDGKVRMAIVIALSYRPRTCSQIAEQYSLSRSSVSRTMGYLLRKGLVTCCNDHYKRNRFYRLTGKGKDIRKEIEEIEAA